MAKTKGQLFSKIDYLFVDIQSQYSEIKKSGEIDAVEVTILEANLASLAKHIEALKIQAQANTSATSQNVESSKNIFTPPTEIKKPVDDTQEVFEEIEEELPKTPVRSTDQNGIVGYDLYEAKYDEKLSALPKVTASSDTKSVKVSITQAKSLQEPSVVKFDHNGVVKTYHVKFAQ